MPHDRINRLAENTLELKIIDSNSNYERACLELCKVAVLRSEHICILRIDLCMIYDPVRQYIRYITTDTTSSEQNPSISSST